LINDALEPLPNQSHNRCIQAVLMVAVESFSHGRHELSENNYWFQSWEQNIKCRRWARRVFELNVKRTQSFTENNNNRRPHSLAMTDHKTSGHAQPQQLSNGSDRSSWKWDQACPRLNMDKPFPILEILPLKAMRDSTDGKTAMAGGE